MNNGDCWVNLTADFGVPWKVLTLRLRSRLGKEFADKAAEWNSTSADKEKWLPLLAKSIIVKARPDLEAGLRVIGIRGSRFGVIEFDVTHPEFPPIKQFMAPEPEWLERCPVCRMAVPTEAKTWVKMVDDRAVEVCSEECSK